MVEKSTDCVNPNRFGSIEALSSIFVAYDNWPGTRILPFTKEDVQKAVNEERLDDRPFQSDSVKHELDQLFTKLSTNKTPNDKKDQILSEWMRDYHIRRVAYLVNNFPNDPITLTNDYKIRDGVHRVIAAITIGKDEIFCLIKK